MADTNTKYNFLDYEGLALFWNNVKNIIDTDKIETNNAITNLDTRVDTVEGALANQIISITYTDLKTLRDSSQLVPGQQYRITDYTCTTTTAGTKSAGHVFDIIVTADDENTLNAVARAIQHDGDSYFSGCDLNAWKIWYCLDNDTTRFKWADETNGKGVIYRMIDEWNNDVPYDFKNIQFKHPNDTTTYPYYYYTFASSNVEDNTDYSLSITNRCYSNTISEYIDNIDNKMSLNSIIFIGNNCFNNSFGANCYNNSFGSECYNNSFGDGCYVNSFGDVCDYNIFGEECYDNTFTGEFNTNTFGNNCYSNSFEFDCCSNTFGNDCYSNTFGEDCYGNSLGNECFSNYFGKSCHNNNFGNICLSNYFGESCNRNSFGNECCYIKFASDSSATSKYNYYRHNHFGDGCQYILLKGEETASSSAQVQNYNFAQGTRGTEEEYIIIDGKRNRSYETYISKDTDGKIKESIIAEKLDKIIEINHAGLVALRDSSKLVPGQQYRITDYTCTTTTAGTTSAGHAFDIIVIADSEGILNEEARATLHAGDSYFANSDLNAWKIWYCIDNDTARFNWADETNGKGVIYRMIDEFNNDVPYDFKNIQFYRQWDSSKSLWSTISSDNTGVPCYTFSSAGSSSTTSFTDMSLSISNVVYSNVIKGYVKNNKQTLNNNCFFGTNCYNNLFNADCYNNSFKASFRNNTFETGCHDNSFGSLCNSNSLGNYCYNNIFGNGCTHNSFGSNCYSNSFIGQFIRKNSFGSNCYSNTVVGRFEYNSFGNECYNNTFGDNCSGNSFGNYCNSNSFGNDCNSNSFGNTCYHNTFGNECQSNALGNECQNNTFGDSCKYNSFENYCNNNTFGNGCYTNTFGNKCRNNILRDYCERNSFGNRCLGNSFYNACCDNSLGNNCLYNSLGINCMFNSFGNGCANNSFRVSANTGSTLTNYVRYNHFDDGCLNNVIWNRDTTSSSVLLQNININRGVVGTDSSYNMININTLNSEQEINVNQIDGIVSIGNILSIKYESLKTIRDNAKLIPGQQYRIIDYIATTSQENTQSAGHQFDIIVTALDESTLSEEAQAIQNSNDGYFDGSNLSAWKIWYCLDNDTSRFAWAGDNVKVGEIEHKSYDSSKCTIKPELINGNAFITPFNFESCVWVDGNNDGFAYSDDHINHDISELIYEWGYFTDENGVKQLCIYKSDAGYYAEEGQPDYGDKYLYKGVVNVDGVEYDYWQKWDVDGDGGIHVGGGDDYVFATTQRIVSNPEAYSVTISTEDVYGPGKGVIYRMIDEWNNDVPYDFKNIQFKHPNDTTTYPHYYYTFASDNVENNTDYSLDIANSCYSNVILEYSSSGKRMLNNIIFIGSYCYGNSFGSDCSANSFGSNCHGNSFISDCYDNTFGSDCYDNSFGSDCYDNSFGDGCYDNSFGPDCSANSFGSDCSANSFGSSCSYNSFRVSASSTSALKDYVYGNHFDDGCLCNVIWNSDTTSSTVLLKNININRGVVGTSSSYNMININTLNQDYEIQVAKNSKGDIKIYCEADLIA